MGDIFFTLMPAGAVACS